MISTSWWRDRAIEHARWCRDRFREQSTWWGAALVVILSVSMSTDMLNDTTARLQAAIGVVAAIKLIMVREA